MMSIRLMSEYVFDGEIGELISDFDEIVQSHPREFEFQNTEAALTWVVRGALDYFDKLDSDFLGQGNDTGIPSMEADHFANNFYRLSNTLDYLCKLWNISLDQPKEWNLLRDIRTLVVHSGEQLTNIAFIETDKYKDVQLGRIYKKREDLISTYKFDKEFDYRIQVWTDKHDKSKRRENDIDHDNRKQNFKEIDIYLNVEEVRNTILVQVGNFIAAVKGKPAKSMVPRKLPEMLKEQVVNDLDFEKLENLVKNKRRGNYFIENGETIWDGFGLKRLYQYVSGRTNVSEDVRDTFKQIISRRVEEFWNAYNNESIDDYDIPSLDVYNVFRDYTPEFEQKAYFESKSLIIAPAFNKKDDVTSPDIDYLLKFLYAVSEALGVEIDLKNNVDGIICDYFVKSVEMKLRESAKTNEE
ncbi:hypothetical protein [Erysipelothrix anatis]|uniref:hypothetical protein n=1 Tax=Erysipelothrix anatis TaxID=2683713 RepID=UPI00135CC227|nr:hypothetical protein [Erysipelothrix anatis]